MMILERLLSNVARSVDLDNQALAWPNRPRVGGVEPNRAQTRTIPPQVWSNPPEYVV